MSQTAEKKVVFVLLGMPGVGKGTQAKLLAETYNLFHIDTGFCLRNEISSGSALGNLAKSYVDKGELVPFDVVIQVIKAAMISIPADKRGYLFDGFPRNRDQAEGLNTMLSDLSLNIQAVFYLETPYDILMDRLAYRVTCGQCDTKYNLKLKPPKQEGVCDLCGGALVTRKDDHPDVIGNRLKAYEQETSPLIAYYDGFQKLKRIDADQPIETVFKQITAQADTFFNIPSQV